MISIISNEVSSWLDQLNLNLTSKEANTDRELLSCMERALDYFSLLTMDQVEELYNLYRLDFILFSYTHQPFLNAAKGNLSQEKVSRLDDFSKPYKNNLPSFNFGSLFQHLKFSSRQEKETSKKVNIEEKKNMEFLARAETKQILQIEHFNNQFSPS